MLKRRASKQRQFVITPRALELFLELQTHERSTDTWYSVHDALHKELGARMWEWPLDCRVGGPYWFALEAAAEAAESARQPIAVAK
jgi:hypothetical protein